MISERTRRLVAGGLFIALAVGLGYALAPYPNIELVTVVVFLSGYFMGWRMGAFVGAAAAFIFFTFNPYGMGFPPVLAMQIFSMAFSGISGGLTRKYLNELKGWRLIAGFALLGFSLTLLYDFLTTLGEVIIIGFSVQHFMQTVQAFAARFLLGIGFYIVHISSNTIIFGALAPLFLRKLPLNRFQNKLVVCLFFLCLTCSAFARQEEPPKQQPPPSDSLKNALRADTLSVPSATDSTAIKAKKRNRILLDFLPADAAALHFTRKELASQLYEDTAELFQNLPGTRVARSADLGLFAQMAVFGAPPRFTEVQFDGIPWPKGFYGQTNLTAIPEVFADDVMIAPHKTHIDFSSSPPHAPKPWTYIEYVKGPFDIDVMRVRFKRSFSKRIHPYLAFIFSNSNGQPLTRNGVQRGGPYDATKAYIRTDYLLNQDYCLRHRFIKSDNDAVNTSPFFFEELPEIIDTNARYEDSRLMNSLELSKTAQITDSANTNFGELDIWRIRLYNWVNSEEYRDNAQAHFIQHKNNIIGGSLNWRWFKPKFSIRTYASLERHTISSPTINLAAKNRLETQILSQFRITPRLSLDSEIKALYHPDFDANIGGLLQITLTVSNGVRLYGKLERKLSLPGAGEYANELPAVLTINNALAIAKLNKFESGIHIKKPKFRLFAALNSNSPEKILALNLSDSLYILSNLPDTKSFHAYSIAGAWYPLHGLQIDFKFDGAIEDLSGNYTFWYLPKNNYRISLQSGRSLFQNDLRVELMLRARYLGKRIVPEYGIGILPSTFILPGGHFIDAELKLHYKDAIIFFRFDNIFRQDLDWRLLQPVRSRTFRYGINWRFWN